MAIDNPFEDIGNLSVKKYDLEFMEDENNPVDNSETNAYGYRKDWFLEGKEEEDSEEEAPSQPLGLSLEELEEIRKTAYEEGHAEGKETGYKEGFAEGYKKGESEGFVQGEARGEQEGLAKGQHVVNEQAARLNNFANLLVEPILSVDAEVASELIYLASRMAKAFIKDELSRSPSYISRAISDVLRLLPIASSSVSLKLSPNDYELLQTAFANTNVKLSVDNSLVPGDLHADVDMSSIDMSVEERIDNYLTEFLALNNDKSRLAFNNEQVKKEQFKADTNEQQPTNDVNPPNTTAATNATNSASESTSNSQNTSSPTNSSTTDNIVDNTNAPINPGNQDIQKQTINEQEMLNNQKANEQVAPKPVSPKSAGISFAPPPKK